MSQKDNILQELSELNSSLPVNQLNPYQVPAGYFDGVIGQVMNRIKALEARNSTEELEHLSPFLNRISRKMPYAVPQNYFQELDTHFVTVDDDKELETLSPLLSGLNKQTPYTVPTGYFEQINAPLETKKTARVVSFGTPKWMRYAAAAVITGLIILAAFNFGGSKQSGQKALAKFSKDVKKMNEVQKDNLLEFIDAGMSGDETATLATDNKTTIKNLLQGISEQELKDFEEQTEDIQDVLMTN